MTKLFERHEQILAAYAAALGGCDPDTVDIVDLIPAIYAAVPGATDEQIVAALRWGARQDEREARSLERERP